MSETEGMAANGEPTLERLAPEEITQVHLGESFDVDELAPPRTNVVLGEAERAERTFIEACEGIDGVDATAPRDRPQHHQISAEWIGPVATANVWDADPDDVEGLLGVVNELELEFEEEVYDRLGEHL